MYSTVSNHVHCDIKVQRGGKQGGNRNEESTKAARSTLIPDTGKTVVQYIWNIFFKLGLTFLDCYYLRV